MVSISALFLVSATLMSAQASMVDQGSSVNDSQILEAYQRGNCSSLDPQLENLPLRPNILAVLAACQADPKKAERLFAKAELADPHGDLIAVLHARYLSTDPSLASESARFDAARPHWIRVLMYARSESLRDMARDALSGLPPARTPMNLSSWTWTAQAQLGAHHSSAPWFRDLPDLVPASSMAADADLFFRIQHWVRAGSISGVYRLNATEYKDQPARKVSTQNHHFELPLELRVGKSEDLIFRAFFDHARLGSVTFSNGGGIGFSGVAYRNEHKQTVSGYAASEHTSIAELRSPSQAHYHFDYQWEWFPPRWLLLTTFGVDNYSADRIANLRGAKGDFNQSHTDISAKFTVRRGFDRFSLGLNLAAELREDAHTSTYIRPVDLTPRSGRREDTLLELEPHLVFKVLPRLQLKTYFKQSWIQSSVSALDYGVDHSHNETTVGASLRTYWSSY